jgi:acetylornithine/N-succinyldiaminopimelate aminotransferase
VLNPLSPNAAVQRASTVQSQAWMERARINLLQNYKQQPLVLERGQGTRVWDADGGSTWTFWGASQRCPSGTATRKLRLR